MKIRAFSLQLTAFVTFFALTGLAVGADPTADQQTTARIQARVEAPIAARNLKGYCKAFLDNDDYRGYATRACEAGVKVGIRKPEQCTSKAVAIQTKEDQKKCLKMEDEAFDATISKHRETKAKFIEEMAAQGLDGEKLIAAEREKLRKK